MADDDDDDLAIVEQKLRKLEAEEPSLIQIRGNAAGAAAEEGGGQDEDYEDDFEVSASRPDDVLPGGFTEEDGYEMIETVEAPQGGQPPPSFAI